MENFEFRGGYKIITTSKDHTSQGLKAGPSSMPKRSSQPKTHKNPTSQQKNPSTPKTQSPKVNPFPIISKNMPESFSTTRDFLSIIAPKPLVGCIRGRSKGHYSVPEALKGLATTRKRENSSSCYQPART
ncbi:hypothetical protein VP01_5078g1 [Puccinia sorghi]|uniref:Uncharacterized protein n=1 Tax=Puccinia sorghi TaxID=27349 RepID=A0A0L6UM75_9BASI|nr:hypothetical protein VP01_5078g1 [Puccinia sorghi]